eukprot:6562778-Alexandrium_andersonii.AAC.1
MNARAGTQGVWTRRAFDTTMTRKDHVPVAMLVPLHPSQNRKWRKRKAPVCDVVLLDRPEVRARLADMLQRIPPIPWEVDPDTHVAMLNEVTRGVLAEVAPVAKRPRKIGSPSARGRSWTG